MSVNAKAVIAGTLYWPFLERQNPMKAGKWSVDLGQLDKAAVKTLKELGLTGNIKEDDEAKAEKEGKPYRGKFISLKTGYPPKVFDQQRNDVDADSIGNGTKANVRVTSYDYPAGPTWKAGVGAGFNAVQVTNLVEFVRSVDVSDFDFDEEDDFADDDVIDIGEAADGEFSDD
jgi:hypothetical protein|tara:strand:- start:1079 stop:1597 length:519 start_codon:yes stop_codon:yes gene_type:complete